MKNLKWMLLLVLAMMQTVVWAQEPKWMTHNQTYKVKGNPNIVSFVEAITGTAKDGWIDGDPVYDLRNGYFSFSQEGAGSIHMNISYWNRKDGRKLVVLAYEVNDFGECPTAIVSSWGHRCWEPLDGVDGGMVKEAGFRAYLYDAEKKQLEPLDNPPFRGFDGPKEAIYYLELPQKGKDIRVREHVTGTYYSIYHLLHWNGMEFEFEEAAPVSLYVRYNSGSTMHLYDEPDGKVVYQVGDDTTMAIDYMFMDWCHIVGGKIYDPAEDKLETLPKGDYWIHNSAIGATGMGAGNVTLYAEPRQGAAVVYAGQEEELIRPLEIMGKWVKVRVEGKQIEGWIEMIEICSNPLTNCC